MCILGAHVTTQSRGKFSAGPVDGVSPVEILESQSQPLVLAQPVPTQHVGPIPEETPETPTITPEETPPPLLPDRLPDSQQELPETQVATEVDVTRKGGNQVFPTETPAKEDAPAKESDPGESASAAPPPPPEPKSGGRDPNYFKFPGRINWILGTCMPYSFR